METKKIKIMIVEDDRKLRRLLEIELEHEGFEIVSFSEGLDAIENFKDFNPDIVLLDVMLPDMDGFEIAEQLRKMSPDVGIIMLTALGMTKDKVKGFESGADDYITKPFETAELLVRIRALLRRKNQLIITPIVFGELKIYENEMKVVYKEKEIELSKTEFNLLLYLIKNRGRIVSKEEILNAIWGIDYYGSENTVEVYINYLRKKLSPDLIKTVRSVGYKLVI